MNMYVKNGIKYLIHYIKNYNYNTYMDLFYTTEKYPKMKILEDNYEIIKNEIPKFIFENIKIKRTRDDWDEKAQDLIKSLEHNKEWIFSWQA